MYRLLIRLSKPSPLIHKSGFRMFFSSPSSVTGPFVRLGATAKEDSPDILLFDLAKEELITVPDKPLPQELADSTVVGTCHGWGFFSDLRDRSLCISDYLNPLVSKSNPPKVIPLPAFTALYTFQTQALCSVAMSSSSPGGGDEDCVVAANFLGRQLSFCETRPNRDRRWTNLVAPFAFLQSSSLMYSKRDRKLYLPAPGGDYLCSWDLHLKKDDNPKFHKFLCKNSPKLSQSQHELLDSCSREEHWVESPSGERFLVRCCTHDSHVPLPPDPVLTVFREQETTEEGTVMCYTEDIGDLCIFISGADSFCVEASLCPGLVPNSIYLMESVCGVYNLATRSIRHFVDQLKGAPEIGTSETDCIPWLPYTSLSYWLPPVVNKESSIGL